MSELFYDHDGIKVFHADCIEILAAMSPDDAVDVIATDPPYNQVNRKSGGLRKLDKGAADSAPINIPVLAWLFSRLCRGSAYIFCSTEQVSAWRSELINNGFSTRHGFWRKTNPAPLNGQSMWLSGVENIIYGRKGDAEFNEHCQNFVFDGPSETYKGHTTPKPLWLMMRMLAASTKPGDTILDPYCGCGTSLWAAKNLGLKAIGIDNNKGYCELTRERCDQGVLEINHPFDPAKIVSDEDHPAQQKLFEQKKKKPLF